MTLIWLVDSPAPAHAGMTEVETHFGERSGKIVLHWQQPVRVQTEVIPRELLLRFSEPLDAPALAVLAHDKPDWLDSVGTGYDTLLLATTQDTQFDVVQDKQRTIIYLSPLRATAPDTYVSGAAARLQMLEAQLMMDSGRQEEGYRKMQQIHEQHPDDTAPLYHMASAAYARGRWLSASRYLEDAASLSPRNEDVAALKQSIDRESAPRVMTRYQWKQTGDDNEHISRTDGFTYLSEGLRLGGGYGVNFIEGNSIQRADGSRGDFTATRHRGEVYLQSDYDDGDISVSSLYFGETSIGAGLEYSLLSGLGRTHLALEWQNPHWDFVEGVFDFATRDRIALRHGARIGNAETSVQIAGNRYNVDGDDPVTDSVSVLARARMPIYEGNPYLTFGYTFDAEYRTDVEYRINAFGERYTPFPLLTREIHYADFSLHSELAPQLEFEGFAGWGFDRFGDNGPSFGASLTQAWGHNLEAQLHASRTLSANETGENVNMAGAYLMWRF